MTNKYQVCPRCEGEGTHTNPAIDGNGLSQECVDDPDFMEAYLGGFYDVPCELCKGQRVVTDEQIEERHEERADLRLAALEDGDYETARYYK